MNEKIVEINKLDFFYDQRKVLEDINLSFNLGDCLGIMGPNGSGKSTLLKIIIGLLKPQHGSIHIMGKSVHQRNSKNIGYVSQKSNSFNIGFPATVSEIVSTGLYAKLGLFHQMKCNDWHKVNEALEQVGLASLANKNIGQLSGGQQQRVFIARALVSEPILLILDEPTVGMDDASTKKLYHLLSYLNQKRGLSLILVAHDVSMLTSYMNQVVYLDKTILFHGKPYDFTKINHQINSSRFD